MGVSKPTRGAWVDATTETVVPWEYRRRDVEPHRARVLLALAIIAMFGLGVILGSIVIVLADRDLRRIDAGSMDPEGERETWLARDIASAALVLCLLPSLLIAIVLILFLASIWG